MDGEQIKNAVLGASAAIGAFIIDILGGWDAALVTLIMFMMADYITGLICALVFKKSPKTQDGAASSRVCFTGLVRKVGILVCVMVAVRLDKIMYTDCCRNAVILFFAGNEGISITENLGLMGVPLPAFITQALEFLRKKSENDDGKQ